jgi:glycosyltransferase involved in cell wall biosynthesis
MARRYRVPEPVVVRNIPEREPVPAAVSNPPGNGRAPVAAYVGILLPNRGLEQSIRALASLDGARLRLIGPIDDGYRAELEAIAGAAAVKERVEFAGSVPPTEVLGALAGADVGLALFQPGCLSHRLVLPNKLFEYALAGVPILGSDLPMIARFVREHGLGATVDPEDVEAIADALSRMLEPERNRELRAAAARAAEALDWRRERERLAAVYREALAGGHSQ